MAFIEQLINETTEKYVLEKNGVAMLAALISTMNDPHTGGVAGFLHRLQQAGLTAQVEAWLQDKDEPPLLPQQLATAIAPTVLQQIAQKAGLPLAQTLAVMTFAIPQIVRHLAAHQAVFTASAEEVRRTLWSQSASPPMLREESAAVSPPSALFQWTKALKAHGARLLRAIPFL